MGDSSQTKDPILVALRVPTERRTKRDLQPIIEFVRGLKFFHSFSQYPHTVEAIASHLNLHTFFSGEIVFSEGDPGDLFYIILDGEVTISKRKKLHSLIDFVTENVVLVKLGVGKYFGETALESQEGLRTATATASKPSNLLSLNRNAYQTILLELKLLLRGAVRRSLSSPSSIFGHINADIIERLSELVVIRTFGLQEEIFSAGRKVNSLMVVKTGIVKLIKSISRRDMDSTIQQEEAKITCYVIAITKSPWIIASNVKAQITSLWTTVAHHQFTCSADSSIITISFESWSSCLPNNFFKTLGASICIEDRVTGLNPFEARKNVPQTRCRRNTIGVLGPHEK
eukprot:gene5083-3631_t